VNSYLITVVAISICAIDIRSHRIPNKVSALFFLVTLVNPHRVQILISAIALVLSIAIFTLTRIGMGDIKVAASLIVNQGSLVLSYQYLKGLSIALTLAIVLHLYSKRSLKGSVAFAPVLLSPFLLLYLAI
jgi:Flp pilus assembly protein protease CpaA